jgi:undecaprenyl-diphosphatase
MYNKPDSHYVKIAWLWIVGFTIFRLIYSGTFLLISDETNYWQWSRYLDWGYHDQAPLIGWAIRLTTWMFGQNELAVRMPSVLSVGIASAYLVAMANRWLGARVALSTAILSQSILEFNVGGLLATPDGLQAAAWAGAAYHVARAYEDNSWSQWLTGGIWFGLGMLAKFTMVAFLPGALAYGLFSAIHRRRLACIRPYIGVFAGSLMFFPVILWNARHHWNSVRHVAFIGGANEPFAIHLNYLGDFLASQAALLSPVVFILAVWAWIRVIRKDYPPVIWMYPYLFWTSFPMIAGFLLLTFHTRVYGNWPGAGYLTTAVLTAAYFGGTGIGRMRRRLWKWGIGIAYGMTALVIMQVVWPILPIPLELDRAAGEIAGWDDLGKAAGRHAEQMPDPHRTFIFGLSYQVASELAFYTPGQPRTVSINRWERPNVYDYWWNDEDLLGWDGVGVTYDSVSHTRLSQVFERVDPPESLEIFRKSSDAAPVKVFYIYRCYGFKGGLRWIPESASDIRSVGHLPGT